MILRFGKLFLFVVLLLFLISFGAINASEDVDESVAVHEDILNEEDLNTSLTTIQCDDRGSFDDVSNKEYFIDLDNKQTDSSGESSYYELSNKNEIVEQNFNQNDVLNEDGKVPVKKQAFMAINNFDRQGYNIFYYGETLRIGVLLTDGYSISEVPTGNVTAICNGNVYHGVPGEYLPSYTNIMDTMNPRIGYVKYNYLFEITNYALGDNVFEFFYSGDENYNNCSYSKTFTSYLSDYNESNYVTGNKTVYFNLFGLDNFKIKDFYNNSYYGAIRFASDFEFGKPLRIAFDLQEMHGDLTDYNVIEFELGEDNIGNGKGITGNVTAICNGNAYQSVFGNYTTYIYQNSKINPHFKVNHVYHYLIEITNYTLGENPIEFIYSGDENYSSFSYLTTFNIVASDYDGLPSHVGKKYAAFGVHVPWVTYNLYDAKGNLTIVYDGVSTVYNLTGDYIIHEFNKFSSYGINNYTIIYSGDDTYNGFFTTGTFDVGSQIYPYSSIAYYMGEIIPLRVDLGNATGFVTFYVNNDTYVVELVDGIAYQEITNYTLGFNRVVMDYSGDGFYPSFTTADYTKGKSEKNLGFTIVRKNNLKISMGLIQNNYTNCIIIHAYNEEGKFGTGTVKVDIDGNVVVLDLFKGVAIYNITEEEINKIKVVYSGDKEFNNVSSSDFIRISDEYIVNNRNYMFYFNQADNGRLFDWVPQGATLDIQGSIIASGASFYVTKPLNIISSTHDSFVDFNTNGGSLFGENPGARFAIMHGGSWSNVTGVNFHNTQIWVENATHVVLDNVSSVVEDQRVGSGVGTVSIRSNSTWCTVKNCYFYTRNNGGSSTLVGAWINNCTFDNNTIVVEGDVGNMLYLTHYNVDIPNGTIINSHVNITNNKLFGPSTPSAICWGIVGGGSTCIIENNTVTMSGPALSAEWSETNQELNSQLIGKITGNTFLGDCEVYASGLIYNNYIEGLLTANGKIYNNTVLNGAYLLGYDIFNNTFKGKIFVYGMNVHDNVFDDCLVRIFEGCNVFNNNITGDIVFMGDVSMSSFGNNVQLYNNWIQGNITEGVRHTYMAVPLNNISIVNNTIYGSINSIRFNSCSIVNNTIESEDVYAVDLKNCRNTVVSSNVIHASEFYGDDAVRNSGSSNVVVNNSPVNPNLIVSAEDIFVGDVLNVNVGFNSTANGHVKVVINGKVYNVNIDESNEKIAVPSLSAGSYIVTAIYDGDELFGPAVKSVVVNVFKFSPVLEVFLDNASVGDNFLVNINVFDASGTVNLIVDGEEHVLSLNNGVASYIIDDIGAGGHSIVAIYDGDDRNEATYSATSFFLNVLETKFFNITVDGDLNINAVLKDSNGKGIEGATILYKIGVQNSSVTTGANGTFVIKGQANTKVDIAYEGTNVLLPTNTSITLNEVSPTRVASKIVASQLTCYAVDTAAGEKGTMFNVILCDDSGKLVNVSVKFALNGKIYNATTDENGVASVQVNIKKANTYTCAISYLGDVKHEASFAAVKVVVNKKKTSITAKAKTFKVKTKIKKYTAILKTVKGSSANGKTYLKPGKKVTLKVGGKTFTSKINKKGKVTFKIVNLNKKGKYSATIKFAGDNTYKSATKKVKITVK